MKSEGEIVLVKNVVFQGGEEEHADLKSLRGRPCIIVDETDDSYYMLPMSTTEYKDKEKEIYTSIVRNKDIYDKGKYHFAPTSYVRLKEMIVRDIYYFERIGILGDRTYHSIIKSLIRLNKLLRENPHNGQLYKKIQRDLEEQSRVLKLR